MQDQTQVASVLLADHGSRAMQMTVDRIVAAIKLNDNEQALYWSEVATELERLRFG